MTMNWMIENYAMIIGAICIGACAGIAIYKFYLLPTNDQLNKVREWLLIAVSQAEKELGGGTGQLKLRMVYGMFIDKFPWLVRVIAFDKFSQLVDEALEQMKEMLQNNKAVKEYIEGE